MARHVSHVPLRWSDLDSLGHVNNTVYLRYLQEARVDMLYVHAPSRGAEELANGMVVRRHEISYREPIRYLRAGDRPEPIRVETWVTAIRAASFDLGYEILDLGVDGERRVYAVASSTLVPYDLADGRPRRIRPNERAVLADYVELDGPTPSLQGALA
ncbi:MAG TPA: thioesterase family protein [Jiangellaceae bacterium]